MLYNGFIDKLLHIMDFPFLVSLQEVDDNIFGNNLNKKKPEEKTSSLPFRKKDWEGITPVKLCHGQKSRKAYTMSEKESSVEVSVS